MELTVQALAPFHRQVCRGRALRLDAFARVGDQRGRAPSRIHDIRVLPVFPARVAVDPNRDRRRGRARELSGAYRKRGDRQVTAVSTSQASARCLHYPGVTNVRGGSFVPVDVLEKYRAAAAGGDRSAGRVLDHAVRIAAAQCPAVSRIARVEAEAVRGSDYEARVISVPVHDPPLPVRRTTAFKYERKAASGGSGPPEIRGSGPDLKPCSGGGADRALATRCAESDGGVDAQEASTKQSDAQASATIDLLRTKH